MLSSGLKAMNNLTVSSGEFQLKIKYHKNASKFMYDIKEHKNIFNILGKNPAIKFLTVSRNFPFFNSI